MYLLVEAWNMFDKMHEKGCVPNEYTFGILIRGYCKTRFLSDSSEKRIPCFRVLDESGHSISSTTLTQLSREVVVKLYKDMSTIQIMDSIFFVAQRQGRISFYLTSDGEEAISVASATALKPDDFILPQVLLLVDPIDEITIQNLKSYKDKSFVDVNKEDLDLGNKNEEKEKEIKQEFGATCDWIKKRLGEKVASVQIV